MAQNICSYRLYYSSSKICSYSLELKIAEGAASFRRRRRRLNFQPNFNLNYPFHI